MEEDNKEYSAHIHTDLSQGTRVSEGENLLGIMVSSLIEDIECQTCGSTDRKLIRGDFKYSSTN